MVEHCDLCADHGLQNEATAEGRLPGGVWASLCAAHAHRLRSAGCQVYELGERDAADNREEIER